MVPLHKRASTVSSTRAANPPAAPPKLPDAQSRLQSPNSPPPVPEPLSRFDVAAARASARYSIEEWVLLDSARRTTAIYAELRRIDGSFSR